jgi:hypothetical protein
MAHNTGINNIKIDEKQEVLSAIFLKTDFKERDGFVLFFSHASLHQYFFCLPTTI